MNTEIKAALEDEMVKDFAEAFHLLARVQELVLKHIRFNGGRGLPELGSASQWIANKRAHRIAAMVDDIVEEENR